jgi:hypothetical protein
MTSIEEIEIATKIIADAVQELLGAKNITE